MIGGAIGYQTTKLGGGYNGKDPFLYRNLNYFFRGSLSLLQLVDSWDNIADKRGWNIVHSVNIMSLLVNTVAIYNNT